MNWQLRRFGRALACDDRETVLVSLSFLNEVRDARVIEKK